MRCGIKLEKQEPWETIGATYEVRVENERVRSRRRFIFYLALPIGYIQ